MQRKLFHFSIIYWAIFCLVVVTASYREGGPYSIKVSE